MRGGGGVGGGVTMVVGMVVGGDPGLAVAVSEFAAVLAILFVLFTLFVQATTLGLAMHLLGLDKLTRVEMALRDRVLALSRINVARHLQEIIRTHNTEVDQLDVDPASAGAPETQTPPPGPALRLRERPQGRLLAL